MITDKLNEKCYTSLSISEVSRILGAFITFAGTNFFHCSIKDDLVLSAKSVWNCPGCELMMNNIGAVGGDVDVADVTKIHDNTNDRTQDIVLVVCPERPTPVPV